MPILSGYVMLGYSSSNELLKYYKVSKEPTFKFIDDFANRIGIKKIG